MNVAWIIGITIGALLISAGGYEVYSATRGLRNNNPGNIEDDGITLWEGIDTPRSEGGYLRFTNPIYGIRAIARILSNYVTVDGIPPTVSALIARWAPPETNNTQAYIDDVNTQLGLSVPDDYIDLSSQMVPLIIAIIRHENSLQPYSASTIAQAVSLA